jgi:hypothetical protein
VFAQDLIDPTRFGDLTYASCLEQSRSSSDSGIALYDSPFLEEERKKLLLGWVKTLWS